MNSESTGCFIAVLSEGTTVGTTTLSFLAKTSETTDCVLTVLSSESTAKSKTLISDVLDKKESTVVSTAVPLESIAIEQPVLSYFKGEKGDANVIDHMLKDSGDYILKEFEYVTP